MKFLASLFVGICLVASGGASFGAQSWVFTMVDSVSIATAQIQLSDLAAHPLPARVANLNVGSSGMPGNEQCITRKGILRQLVTSGNAGGVSFKGSRSCVVVRTGETLNPHALRPEIRRALQRLVPGSQQGAPATWFELELPAKLAIVDDNNYTLKVAETSPLKPGRNQISVVLNGTNQSINFPVTVTLHQFSETARARMKIKRGDVLMPELFEWQWTDLGQKKRNTDFHGRNSLMGASSARTIQAGDFLRQCDLKPTPVVLTGDRVELQIQRGSVCVSVNATARKEGCIGQTIPVRNEMTKQLVNARVMAPGLVKWRN